MSTAEQFDADLHEALESAVELCQKALADYRAGLLDEDELRRLLFRGGLVQWPDQAWLLDLEAGRWWRYDGVGMGAHAADLESPGVARLRGVIDELAIRGEDRCAE